MIIRELVQLLFSMSNGSSFALTIRNSWKAKVIGSAILVLAHPMVAVYFIVTGQPLFILGNIIMTGAGIYGIVKGLKLRKGQRNDASRPAPRATEES